MDWLRWRGYYVQRLNAGGLPNAQGRTVRMTRKGTPDVLAIKAGRAVFVEFKRLGEEPTEIQLEVQAELRHYGATVLVATSVEDLEAAGL